MSKILSLIIQILNTFNKFIWKIIKFLSKYIEIDDINHDNKDIANIKYCRFNVDSTPPITEAFVSIEHKDYKQLIKDNNIKPINLAMINKYTLILIVLVVVLLKNIFMIIMVKRLNLNAKSVLMSFLIILTRLKILY